MKIRFRTLEDISKLFILIFFAFLFLVALFLCVARIELIAKAEGVVEAKNWTEVRPRVSGIIKEMIVSEGDKVKRGDLLFRLEDEAKKVALLNANLELERLNLERKEAEDEVLWFRQNTKNRIAEQEAVLFAAKAGFEQIIKGSRPEEIEQAKSKVEMMFIMAKQTETEYRRKEKEAELGLASAREKERARFEWEIASANLEVEKKNLCLLQSKYSDEEKRIAFMKVKEAEARLSQIMDEERKEKTLREKLSKIEKEIEKKQNEIELLKKETGNLLIYSEADGVILTKETQHLIGRFVGPGETVLKIGKIKDYVVKAFIKERDRPKVKCGQKAKIFVKAFPHGEYKVFKGKVINVSEERIEKGLYGVTITVFEPYVIRDGKPYFLQIGYAVEANIITEKDRIIKILLKLLKRMRGEILPKNIYLFEETK